MQEKQSKYKTLILCLCMVYICTIAIARTSMNTRGGHLHTATISGEITTDTGRGNTDEYGKIREKTKNCDLCRTRAAER